MVADLSEIQDCEAFVLEAGTAGRNLFQQTEIRFRFGRH